MEEVVIKKVRYRGQSDPVSLIHGKVYDVIGIEKGWYRLIDEEGYDEYEDVQGYLYPPEMFDEVKDA